MPPVQPERKPRRRVRAAAVAGALFVTLVIPAATFAAKPSTMTPWIALASSGTDLAPSQPALGSTVRFASGYPTNTRNPWVSVNCYQGGTWVYGEGGTPSSDFMLGGAVSPWVEVGGPASCTAELGDLYWKGGRQYYTFLAQTSFDATQ